MRRYTHNDEAHLIGRISRALYLLAEGVRCLWVIRRLGGKYNAAWRYFLSCHRKDQLRDNLHSFKLSGVSIAARPKDWCAFDEVVCRDEYAFVDKILAAYPRPIVLDLGANIGLFAARVLRVCPHAHVLSVEPSRSTFGVLKKNCEQNRQYRWHAIHGALWKNDGVVCFQEAGQSAGSHVSAHGAETVPAVTLTRFMREYAPSWVNLAKMDIEGAEEVVLTEHARCLRRVGCLIVEIHPNRCSVERVVSILRDHFSYLHTVPGRRSTKPLIVAARRRYPLPLLAA